MSLENVAASGISSPSGAAQLPKNVPTIPSSTHVLKELKKIRNRETSVKNFGRFLVSFGVSVAIIGGVAIVAAAILSSPIGFAVGIGVAAIALGVGVIGVGIVSTQERHKCSGLLDSIRRGIVAALGTMTFGLFSGADQESLKRGQDKGPSRGIDTPSRLYNGIVFGIWQGRKENSSISYSVKALGNKKEYEFSEDAKVMLTIDVSFEKTVTQDTRMQAFIDERKSREHVLLAGRTKTQAYDDRVLPLVKKDLCRDACDILWLLYSDETKPEEKLKYAVEIAALMLRARKKASGKESFETEKENTLYMLMQEIEKNAANPSSQFPQLLIAYKRLVE